MESDHQFSFRPDCNSTEEVPSFSAPVSAIPFVSGLCGVDVQWFQGRSSQDLPNPKELSVWMTFGFLVGSRNFILGSSGTPEKFLFCTGRIVTTVLPTLVPPRHVDECCVIHFLHWEFCNPQYLNHQNVPLWPRLFQHVFCKKSSSFSSSSRCRNLGLSGSECRYCACQSPVPLLLATPLVIREKNWKCLDPQAQGFAVALKDYFYRPNSLRTPAANPASHAIDRSVLLRVLHFICVFCFCWLCTGFLP